MKQGGHQDTAKSGGFTIVETMIVLAVSSLLLGSAILIVNGKQQSAQFKTAIFDLKQRMQQIVNQTVSGYYPNNNDFSCVGGPNGGSLVTFTTSGINNTQGSNGSCVFLGNTVRFGGYSPGTFTVYPMAGNRFGAGGQVAANFTDAWPTAIAPGLTTNTGAPSYQVSEQFEGGLTMAWGSANGGAHVLPTANSFAIAFLGSLTSGINSGTGGLNSGSQQFSLFGFGNPWANPASSGMVVDNIDAAHSAYQVLNNVQICFSSSSTDQSGLITVSNSLVVSLQIKNGLVCA